jgi:hypothetical protein
MGRRRKDGNHSLQKNKINITAEFSGKFSLICFCCINKNQYYKMSCWVDAQFE